MTDSVGFIEGLHDSILPPARVHACARAHMLYHTTDFMVFAEVLHNSRLQRHKLAAARL